MKENERRPEVSVIIPVHNLERYIDACLASVEAQTFGDFEAVVVDDGLDGRFVASRALPCGAGCADRRCRYAQPGSGACP